ncbi:hypothetical protein [Rhodoferax saidenbachensis]|uniref:Uncharacterized protein n=1 Tax=Rhodoferax saidenbachensis TaxID=1484693 RepID=A0A1P8K7J7_9BURK|nr:hypothetical protein [Rhodoferax saidenbachensis]APW41973.1 hypothetical protein RS694_05070 [Rhodoferax saidenbachensis]
MRAIVGVLGLLIVLAIVGLLAKTQLGSMRAKPAVPNTSGVAMPVVTPDATPQQQSQQIQQQVQQSVEGAMQARPMPDDNK